jgi:pimeloyl-ACP methyl ester carboxylesterase
MRREENIGGDGNRPSFCPRARIAVAASVLCIAVSSAVCQTDAAKLAPPGQIVDVTCAADSTQSYALYLPSTYATAKPWPIIYFFDPGGRGRRPVELYKDLAEKYGFVLAASNNSKNFGPEESKSVNAIWQDTHLRFPLDGHLTYVSGFSGGARVAGLMALTCQQCQIAGVIADGAGYPTNWSESKDKLLYFFAVGNQDFNWSEVMTVRRQREDAGLSYRVRVFPGPHQWAPVAVMQEAIEWLMLKAMQAGTRAPDPAWIDSLFHGAEGEAEAAEKKGDAIAQLAAYRSLASDFAGLKKATEYENKLEELKKSAALKAAFKNERAEMADQSALENEVSTKMHAYVNGTADDSITLANDILQAMRRLAQDAEHSKSETKRLIARRAFDGLWVAGIENGQQELELRHYEKADAWFDLMSKVRDDPWPVLLLAETHAAAGNRKLAIKDVREAVRRGLTDASVIESNERLQILNADPDFQKLMAELKPK